MQNPVAATLSGEMPEKANFKRQVELNRTFEGDISDIVIEMSALFKAVGNESIR